MSTKDWTHSLAAVLYSRFPPPPQFGSLLQRAYAASGFTRMAAVHELDRLGHVAGLQALIVRSNDWVAPVRIAAVDAILRLALPANVAAFVACLPLFLHLRQCLRADHGQLIAAVEEFLCRPENTAAVVAAITDVEPRIARACLNLAVSRRLAEPATLVRQGLKQRDLSTRTTVAPLIAELHGDDKDAMLTAALKDANAPLRCAALRIMLAQTPKSVDAQAYLFDRHMAARLLIAAYRQKHGLDPALDYAQELERSDNPQQRRIALWGLGEYGTRDDVAKIRPHLDDSSPGVRREALRAFARRGGEPLRDIVLQALGDPTAAVANEAGRIARRARLQFDCAELLPLLTGSARLSIAATLLAAHRLSNKWERLILMLHVRQCGDEGRKHFVRSVHEWERVFNNSFVPLTAAQSESLQRLLQPETTPPDDHGDPRLIERLRWTAAQ